MASHFSGNITRSESFLFQTRKHVSCSPFASMSMPYNVTVLSSVYPPEPVVSAQTSEQVTCGLVSRGHMVTVLASFPSRPAGKIFPGYRRALYTRQRLPEGYNLIRCFCIPSAKSSGGSRLLENLVFGLASAARLAVLPRSRVIYSNTKPIFASGMMSLVARLRRIPYVLSVQDIYPESFVTQGRASKNSLVSRFMRAIDRQIALHAAHIIVLSEDFANVYHRDRGVPSERVTVVPNWVEEKTFPNNDLSPQELRDRYGIQPQSFLVAYGGNIGVAAGVETIVRAFDYLSDVFGLIAGEGTQLKVCQKLASHAISFLNPWPNELTMPLYHAADVLVLPTRGRQSLASVPSKLIRYMLSGRPVIASGLQGSELAKILEISGCGWLVEPDNPKALAEKIMQVKEMNLEERQRCGEAGRKYALENFTKGVCLPKVINIIEEAAKLGSRI